MKLFAKCLIGAHKIKGSQHIHSIDSYPPLAKVHTCKIWLHTQTFQCQDHAHKTPILPSPPCVNVIAKAVSLRKKGAVLTIVVLSTFATMAPTMSKTMAPHWPPCDLANPDLSSAKTHNKFKICCQMHHQLKAFFAVTEMGEKNE